jgi:hypothetical protein
MIPITDWVTAEEMAKEAKINPKKFRHALRKENFSWHVHYARWTVRRHSPEHKAMERVLDSLRH